MRACAPPVIQILFVAARATTARAHRRSAMTIAASAQPAGVAGTPQPLTSTMNSSAAEVGRSVPPQLLSVAPMMDWTDVSYRQLARLLSRNVWLYTEMVVDSTLIHNTDHDRFLWYPPEQHPIVCQLGGSDPDKLAAAAAAVASYGYDEINLNCGCPSEKVAGKGCFGAAMMLQPALVAQCCAAVSVAVEHKTPVTVKCRIGVDDVDSYAALHEFVAEVSSRSPVRHFVVHARKCLLRGLNPHQNRTVPPLRYQWLWALKRDFPHLNFSLNGGVLTLEEATAALRMPSDEAPGGMQGVMIGRAAYNDPWHTLANADVAIFGAESNPATSRRQVLWEYAKYADAMVGSREVKEDGHRVPSVRCLFKPLLGMFHKEPRGKRWRAAVDGALRNAGSVSEVLEQTLGVLHPETLDEPPTALREVPGTAEACMQLLAHYTLPLPPTPLLERSADEEEEAELGGQQRELTLR